MDCVPRIPAQKIHEHPRITMQRMQQSPGFLFSLRYKTLRIISDENGLPCPG